MNKCIYLKTDENQTFDKEEHIFPAGLGGIEKLPKGYVSDYINGEVFSKLELIFMRESIVAIDRMFLGPGKRGNLSKKKETKSKVVIYCDVNNEDDISLGYIKKGRPYQIKQLIIKNNEKDNLSCNLISSEKDGSAGITKLMNILKETSEQDILNSTKLYDKSLGENDFILGYESGKLYLLVNNKNINSKYIRETINKVINAYEEKRYRSSESAIQPKMNFDFKFSINDFYRVCAKIAFNYLASKKGQEYVLDEKFDKLRAFILDNNGKINCRIIEKELSFPIELPKNSHKIFINKHKGYLYAFISIYGNKNVFIELCKYDSSEEYENILDEGFYGYICDWEARKEYDLVKYIGIVGSNID